MTTAACVACGAEDSKTVATIEGYVAGDTYTIAVCNSCRTRMAVPHRSEHRVYEWIYKNRKSAPGYARYAQFADEVLSARNPLHYLSVREEMYYGVAKQITQNIAKGGKVLDVGCGLGYFTYALVRAGYKATGIDIAEEAIANAKRTYGDSFICGDFFMHSPEEKYDVVCMLELIEHVENPHAYIAHARSLIKPGGLLIITTPNRSWFEESDVWNTDLPPVHLTWFSEKGVTALLGAHNLSAIFFDYTWYTLLHGTVCKPVSAHSVRTPIFDEHGTLLAIPYHKSRVRMFAERLHVYIPLKILLGLFRKSADYACAARHPSRISLRQSGTICACARVTH